MPRQPKPLWDRFWPKVDASGDCWVWTGAYIGPYGAVWVDNARRAGRVHRVAYELLVGPIPDGLTIDHLCRNPPCVNPDHLEPVSVVENVRRQKGGLAVIVERKTQMTHCRRGHEYTPATTLIHNGRRECRPCAALRARLRYVPKAVRRG